MLPDLEGALREFNGAPGATPRDLSAAEAECGRRLPEDYREFLLATDGGEGFIGKNYLMLWASKDLAPFNRDYGVSKFAPGLLLIGSSGGGEAFAFDYTPSGSPRVGRVPFVGMSPNDVIEVAPSFTEFLKRLIRGDLFESP